MNESQIPELARSLVREYGQGAELEVTERAELAVLREDWKDFELWQRVIVFVSDLSKSTSGSEF